MNYKLGLLFYIKENREIIIYWYLTYFAQNNYIVFANTNVIFKN